MKSTSRRLATFGVFALTVAGAFSQQIEYSLRAETESATEVAPAVATPQATRNIDSKAVQLLFQSLDAYTKLQSFSADLKFNGSPQFLSSTIRWQKPNHLAFLIREKGETRRVVSDGKTVWIRTSGNLQKYAQIRWGYYAYANTLEKTLGATAEYDPALTSLKQFRYLFKNKWHLQSVVMASNPVSDSSLYSIVVTFDWTEQKQVATYQIDKKTHLVRRLEEVVTYNNDKIGIPRTVRTLIEYSNLQSNPKLLASTFAFTPRATDKVIKLLKPTKRVDFDTRLKIGAAPFKFTAKDLHGKSISPANYKGRVVLLDFWATWCGPCVAELPNVKANYDKYHAQGFDVVGISLDEDRAALDTFLKKHEIAWPQIFDGKGWKNAVATKYSVRAIPFTVLIGRDGKIVDVGLQRGPELEIALKAALAKK